MINRLNIRQMILTLGAPQPDNHAKHLTHLEEHIEVWEANDPRLPAQRHNPPTAARQDGAE